MSEQRRPVVKRKLAEGMNTVELYVEHRMFEDESGIWCYEDCPAPDDECGELAVENNA